ncbi:hypothetical protein [Pseudomonas sp. RT6P73]
MTYELEFSEQAWKENALCRSPFASAFSMTNRTELTRQMPQL